MLHSTTLNLLPKPLVMQARRMAMLTAVCLCLAATVATGQTLTVAAASDLQSALPAIAAQFEKDTGHPVTLTFGSSGNFFTQIQNGAPYDLYFSADIRYPQKLINSGQGVAESLYTYAIGRIVLWVPVQSNVLVQQRGLESLLDGSIKKIAIANPKHAPYGRAAVAALEKAGLYERVKDRLVYGENVSQAAQFVESGAADAGIIARSLALAPLMEATGLYWEIPAELHPSLEQGVIQLKGAREPAVAAKFLDFLKGSEGRAIMTRFGFVVPGSGANQ